jgi:MYXO-CTERM domain-containing protein
MLERYVKILTVQMDLVVGLRLDASAGQIVPAVASIVAENVNVTDAEIVGPPGNINELFTDLMDLIAGMIPPFEPIALPEFSGFVLEVPDGGIMHVASGGEDFLALFANLALAPTPPGPHLDTSARLTSLRSPADDLAGPPPGRLRDLVPTALVDASAVRPTASPRQTDYRWRVDGGAWSSWTRDPRLVVRSPFLLFAGDHVVEVQSRLADDDSTIDPAPARVPVHIDGVPGAIAGRRTHEQGAAPSRALRGRPSADSGSSACSCTVPGAGAPGSLGLLGLALGAVVLLRRRRLLPALVLGAALAGLGAGGGCDCGKGSGNGGDDGGGDADTPTGCTDDSCAPGRCCPATGQCVELPSEDGFCEPGFECVDEDGDFAPTFDVAACAFTTDCCAEMEPLPEGFVGQHSEVAVTSSGAIWVAGYSAGASERSTYGDLVAGTWNAATTSVDWVHVDGVPADGEIEGGPSGWRGGVAEPGDDVGKYATIAIGIDGEPRVAYYDATNGALKYAAHAAAGWTVRAQPIDDTGDAGRYADMVIGTDGRPVVSYNAIEESADTPGAYVSKIKVAWADDGGGASWTIYEGLDTVPIPCWAALCGEERVCLASTRTCATPEDESLCGEGCDTGQECVAGVCEDVFDAPIDFPEGVGIVTGIDLLPDGTPVVVYYDRGAWDAAEGEVRPHGDLKLAVYNGGTWIVSTLDGGTTDAGWYPSLDIDASGQRHVAYVDGISEDLIYLNVDTAVREVVDGRSVPGGARHIVGDDSSIRVGADGTIWIAYQDATAGILRLARRTGTAAWEIRDVDTQDTTGFFACLVLGVSGPGTPVVSTYWHRTTASGGTTTRYSYAAGVRVFQVTP